MRTALRLAAALAVALTIGPVLQAASTVVYNNLGPNDSYSNQGMAIGNAGSNTFAWGGNFQPSSGGNLSDLWLPMFTAVYPADPLVLSLRADSAGLPGTVLWSETVTDGLPLSDSVFHLDIIGGPLLSAGTRYWLTAEGTSTPFHFVNWHDSGIGEIGMVAQSMNGGAWQVFGGSQTPGMKVGVVPEPSVLVLLGMGVLGLVGWVWRRKGLRARD